MCAVRLAGDLRRGLIVAAAKRCFAQHGFAGTTTKSIAAAAEISEALLFKHFPSKAVLYAEILSEACEADPEYKRLLELEPGTATLVTMFRETVNYFLLAAETPDGDEAQHMRLLVTDYVDGGEFSRLFYGKIELLLTPIFTRSLERAIETGDAYPFAGRSMNLFWFAHQAVNIVALTKLASDPPLSYAYDPDLNRQICEFVLRGIGLKETTIAEHLGNSAPTDSPNALMPEST